MTFAPAFTAVALLLAVTGGIVGTVWRRSRRGVPIAAAGSGFRDDGPLVVDREPLWIIFRMILAGLVLLYGAVGLATHRQGTTLGQLYSDAAAHRMSEVTLSPGLPAGATGSIERRVTWRTGLARWAVTFDQVGANTGTSAVGPAATGPAFDDVQVRLKALDPGLHIRPGPDPSNTAGLTFSSGGLRLTGRAGTAATVTGLAGLVLLLATLASGPQPWRATRWAWFWFFGTPLGWLAFCLLSGPTPVVRTPPNNRRLTGGVAFVLSLLFTGPINGLPHHLLAALRYL